MKIISAFLFCLTMVFFTKPAEAEILKEAYIDQERNVHLITTKGQHRKITRKGNATSLKLAPDNETVAWLVANTWTAEGDIKAGSEELVIYQAGRTASIKCTPFIRDYWFRKGGAQVAINCGGKHFAGRAILYDARSLKVLASFHEADVPLEKRPDWANEDD